MSGRLKVGIDSRALTRGPAGVATYVRQLTSHLACLEPFSPSHPRNNFAWNHLWGPLAQVAKGWQVYHAPAYTAPLVNRSKLVLSVHDVAYLEGPAVYPYRLDRYRLSYYLASIRAADRILVPSSFSRDEILKHCPDVADKLRLVPLGVGEEFGPDARGAEASRQAFQLTQPFLIHVGDIHPRRNVPTIAAVAEKLGLELVLVGRVLAGQPPSGGRIRRFEGLSLESLRGLYSAASAFVYASVYEGFGLPLLEAMACGLPVVAVARASVPEVCSDAAVLVEPDVDALLDGVREAFERREELSARGLRRVREFSWLRTARLTQDVYHELV